MTSEQSLAERVERAESWITAASSLHSTQLHETFLFLSIALNSLVSRRRYEGDKAQVHEDLDEFLKKILVLHKLDQDRGGRLLRKAIQSCRQDGAVLIRDRFLKDAYWRRAEPSPELQQRLVRESLHATGRLLDGDYRTFMSLTFNRITVLRSQITHGCATYGAKSMGRSSLTRGVRFLKVMVPAMHRLIAQYGHAVKWEPVPYPRLGSQEQSYRRA